MTTREGSLDAPTRHPVAWREPDFYDEASLQKEMERVFGCPVIEAYSMTENAHQMTSNQLPPGLRRPAPAISALPRVRGPRTIGKAHVPDWDAQLSLGHETGIADLPDRHVARVPPIVRLHLSGLRIPYRRELHP